MIRSSDAVRLEELVFDDEVRKKLDQIREDCGFPLPVTSGYRCPNHP